MPIVARTLVISIVGGLVILLTAIFATNASSYTIQALSQKTGSISSSTTGITSKGKWAIETIGESDSVIYTITPNVGYKVADVVVNGVSKGAIESYTFSKIASNQEIRARFAKSAFYVKTLAPMTCGVTSTLGTSFNKGKWTTEDINNTETVTYTIDPGVGYQVTDVQVNGDSIGAVTTYTIANPARNSRVRIFVSKRQTTWHN